MKKKIVSFFLALTFLCSAVNAKIRVLTIGDSTMADYDEVKNSGENEMRGWAQMLSLFFDSDVTVENAAKNGRSSKSFYYEFWEKLRETLKPGDYVIIQFGHNDEKNNGKDTPPKDKAGRGTAPWGQFHEYLTRYVNESRAHGAIPILATPIVRRMFDANGKELVAQAKHNLDEVLKSPNDTLYDYVLAMKSVAKELNVPIIDMTALTETTVKKLGPDKSKDLIYCVKDNTHLKALGALMYANLFAQDMKQKGILSQHLSTPSEMTLVPQKLDFGSVYLGESITKAISFNAIDLKSPTKINLSVSEPYSISLSADKDFTNKLELRASNGDFFKAVYVRFSPGAGRTFLKKYPIMIGDKKIDLAVTGEGIAADRKKAFNFEYSSRYGLSAQKKQAELNTQLTGLKYLVDLNETLVTTSDGSWPSDEIDVNADRYFEISVKAKKDLYISQTYYRLTGVSADKMQFTALGAFDKTFSKPDTYSLMESLGAQPKQFTQRVMIKLTKGKTYYFRIYPWSAKGGDQQSIKIENIMFKGYEMK